MKRIRLLLTLLIMLVFSSTTRADVIQVGSGDVSSKNFPTNVYFNYSLTQQIYTHDELWNSAKNITSISFYNNGEERTRNIDIYLVPTTKTVFNSDTDWIEFAEENKVFSGDVTFGQDTWTDIGFNLKPFLYDGSSNLALIVDDNTGAWKKDVPFKAFNAESQSLGINGDQINYHASKLNQYIGTVENIKNQVKFNETGLDTTPYDLTVSDILPNSANITWKSLGKKWNMRFKLKDSSSWYYFRGLTSPSNKLTGIVQDTTFVVEVQTDNCDGTFSKYASTEFTTPERYPRPTNLEVLNVTPFTATLNWTENGTATSWLIIAGDKRYIAHKKPFILTGLEQGTEYRIGIRAIIDLDDEVYGNWSKDPLYITTPLVNPLPELSSVTTSPTSATIAWKGESDSYQVKYRRYSSETYFEDFDEAIAEDLPEGWIAIDADGDDYNWMPYAAAVHKYINAGTVTNMPLGHNDSPGYVSSGSYSNIGSVILTPDNYLVSPLVELGGHLSFWACTQDIEFPSEHFGIAISTTSQTDPSAFTTIAEWTITPEGKPKSSRREVRGEWGQFRVDLSAYAGQTGYVAIRHFNSTNQFILNIDDFGIYETDQETTEEWTTIDTAEKSVTIEGLDPNTKYEFEVAGIMSNEEDAPSGLYTFITLSLNPEPQNVIVRPELNSASLSWTGYGYNYEVKYRKIPVGGSDHYSCDFDDGSLSSNGWTVITDAETIPEQSNGWYLTSSGSSRAVCSNSYYYNTENQQDVDIQADNWLITPRVPLGGRVSFKAWIRQTYPEEFAVLLSTTGKEKSDFTEVLRPLSPGNWDGWTTLEYDLSAYAGKEGYIAIRDNCYGKFYMYIDDFNIEFGEVSLDKAEVRLAYFPHITLFGLEKDTNYECQIISKLSGQPDAQTYITFKTKNDPIDIALDDDGNNTSILKLHEGENANVTINNRTLTRDKKWQGICLPFDVDVLNSELLQDADVRTLESVTVVGDYVFMNCLTPVNKMQAGRPYIIRWNKNLPAIENPCFENVVIDLVDCDVDAVLDGTDVGVYNRNGGSYSSIFYSTYNVFSGDEEYIFLMNGTPTLSPANSDGGLTIHAFDIMFYTYQIYRDGMVVILNTGDQEELITGISSLEEKEEGSIYNLAGQRLSKKQKGINIVGGRKVLVK